MSDLYNRIEDLCKERKITITDMCRACGAPRGSLSDLKMGRTNGLSTSTLSKIAKYFGVSVSHILGQGGLDDMYYRTAVENNMMAAAEMFQVNGHKKTAGQMADGLRGTGYELLTPENKEVIDALIEKLLKLQSHE